jgi:replicative DNA helicase
MASELVELYLNKRDDIDRIVYPFQALNRVSKGRDRGSLTVWGGYSSDGKSIIGMQSALAAAQAGYSVGYFSLEMTEEELLYRLLSMHTGIPKQRIEDEELDILEMGSV